MVDGKAKEVVDTGVGTAVEDESEATVDTEWRKHVDATVFDLFRYVDSVNDKEFSAWLKDAKKWFYDAFTEGAWLSDEVDITKSTMFKYDRDRSCSTDDQIRANLKPITMILPMLMKKINIITDALVIERITTASKQTNSSDCGVYVIKYIEFLSIDRQAELVNGFYMHKWRKKLAVELYTLDCTL
ncbi:Ubiquitin-like protease domain-containing protein [Abeliophyllum distichum]|uniref:Ubiquitin-like protease domain-containing protein n=1 Tax=Abeliophyllum distichum TaxID=126358 RepID=A0ABD1QF72_9LAMI